MDVLAREETSDLIKIVKRIKEILEGRNTVTSMGLCTNINNELCQSTSYAWRRISPVLFRDWPLYSGLPKHPVPATSPEQSPFLAYMTTRNLYEGEYGELRINLANYIIDRLVEAIEERS